MPDLCDTIGWIGRRLDDVHGTRIGRVQDVVVDHGTPEWLMVHAGWLRRRGLAVAVSDVTDEGGRLRTLCERERAVREPQAAWPG